MTAFTVPSGTFTISETLTANTADTVTFADRGGYVAVTNTGTTVLYARADGVTAVAAAEGCLAVMPGTTQLLANRLELWYQSSKVIPAGSTQIPQGGGAPAVATSPTQGTSSANPGVTQPYMSSAAGQEANPGTKVSIISTEADSYTVALAG